MLFSPTLKNKTQAKLTHKIVRSNSLSTLKITNPNIASIILNPMSLCNLGNKQTIILHNCEINNEKYDLVITPHRQSTGYIRTKRQTIKQKILCKQRQNTRKKFSKQRNAFSESETSHLQELYRLKNSINKKYPVNYPVYFFDSEVTSRSSIQGKRRIKNSYKNKPVRIYTIGIKQ